MADDQNNNGLFPHVSFAAELETIRTGNFKQVKVLSIPTANVGFPSVGGSRGLFEVEGNGLFLLSRTLSDDLVEQATSPAARIYVKLNHPDNPWLPLSYIANSLDLCAITGVFFRFWLYVAQPGPGNAQLAVLRGVAVGSSGTTAGGSGGGETGFGTSKA